MKVTPILIAVIIGNKYWQMEVMRKLDEQMKEKEWETAMRLREKQHDKELVDSVKILAC